MNGDSPLGWASWYLRPDSILRKLSYGDFQIEPGREGMRAYLSRQAPSSVRREAPAAGVPVPGPANRQRPASFGGRRACNCEKPCS